MIWTKNKTRSGVCASAVLWAASAVIFICGGGVGGKVWGAGAELVGGGAEEAWPVWVDVKEQEGERQGAQGGANVVAAESGKGQATAEVAGRVESGHAGAVSAGVEKKSVEVQAGSGEKKVVEQVEKKAGAVAGGQVVAGEGAGKELEKKVKEGGRESLPLGAGKGVGGGVGVGNGGAASGGGQSGGGVPGSNDVTLGWVMQTGVALGAVVGLILLMRWLVGKWGGMGGGARSGPAVEVLSKVMVGVKSYVVLLRVGHRVLVVSESGGVMQTLSVIKDPDEIASVLAAVSSGRPASITGGFKAMLEQMGGEYQKGLVDMTDEGGDEEEVEVDRLRDRVSLLTAQVRANNWREVQE